MTHKAFAKVNVFLKIVGTRGTYHEISSRFVLVESVYDKLCFAPKKSKEAFELYGDFGCELEKNTIYKSYEALKSAGFKRKVMDLFSKISLHVRKNIPSFAGLGGGSSDAATFLLMVNDEADLGLSKEKLAKIGSHVGADIPFFIYGYKSANVSGIGEKVEEFKEKPLRVEIFTPDIKCDTQKVYKAFRENYKVDLKLADTMSKMSSVELLSSYSDAELNDLLIPAMMVDKKLELQRKKDWFFSGSGSSFFRIKGDN
jgi:4-diphosphocytidyl-2-C-methyl-D-erythritol kinase